MRALVIEVYGQLTSDLVHAYKDYKVKEKKFEKDKLFTGIYIYIYNVVNMMLILVLYY